MESSSFKTPTAAGARTSTAGRCFPTRARRPSRWRAPSNRKPTARSSALTRSKSKAGTGTSFPRRCGRRSAPPGPRFGETSASRPMVRRPPSCSAPPWRAPMYRYDEFDAAFVSARVDQFRGQVARRITGELTEEQFRPHRLMNGLYLQLHAYMLRVAIPYGTLNSLQLRKLAEIARKYDRGYGHFTTRQNIQYNWPALKDTPDILAELSSVEMHAIQTSGNVVRNITTDQWAGVAPDEIEDPRVWAEVIRQHVTLHPEFSFMPRKFKI